MNIAIIDTDRESNRAIMAGVRDRFPGEFVCFQNAYDALNNIDSFRDCDVIIIAHEIMAGNDTFYNMFNL